MDEAERSKKLEELLARAKAVALEYYELTKKPLGITGEIAEYEAATKLGLTLCAARNERVDAYKQVDGRTVHYQIKGRAIPRDEVRSHRVSAIFDGEFEFVVLVLLDKLTLQPFEIWQAERVAVMQRLDNLKGNAALIRRSMSISQFRSIPGAEKVWPC